MNDRGSRACPRTVRAGSPRILEPRQLGDLSLGEQCGVTGVHDDAVCLELLDEALQIGFVRHSPTGVEEFVLLSGMDRDPVADVVHREPDRAVGSVVGQHRAELSCAVGAPVLRSR